MLMNSKKATWTAVGMAFVAVVTISLSEYTTMSDALITAIGTMLSSIVGAYLVGQGLSDQGKEAAKITAANPVSPTTTIVNQPDIQEISTRDNNNEPN